MKFATQAGRAAEERQTRHPMAQPQAAATRPIVLRTKGRRHGPVTRIVSPGDVGQLIKPFVFLDYFDFAPSGDALFPMHPHSGIATLTVLIEGELNYEDTTGAAGMLHSGSVEWMRAGNGIWHGASPAKGERFQGYQLWIALPRSLENGLPHSQYLPASSIPRTGPARVILGTQSGRDSPVAAPSGVALQHVRLAAGERWRYQPPEGHTVAWAHANRGTLAVDDEFLHNELVVFAQSEDPLEFAAQSDADFIIASAVPHPHDLSLGYYSVHTSDEALRKGEAEIARIGMQLRAEGRLR
ncbi:pirin family protein [Cupriavidus sp. CV2]|uniref:pirin family protein n=1 Tax=Cupriavidus ulmosensis TaxID=3065913 RepID=UPI00296B10E4|nr:pirin family protein [Cupriavidus sp. CV2]MDW3680601.1 pirin family protein [Cupriavidus sp. CV2]